MSDEKLKLVDTCALLVLLGEAQEIANADLKNLRGFELKTEDRNRLEKAGLVDVRREGRRVFLGVSDHGWRHALDLIGTEPPKGSGYKGAAIYAQVAALRNYLGTAGLALSDYFVPRPEARPAGPAPEPAGGDVTALIRAAYARVARQPGDAVGLAEIRTALPGIDRDEVDEALRALNREPGVRVFGEDNQKTLTAADRAAAVSIGNQDKHLLVIK
ncbi:hypothetical protein [Pseudosporangium ferrugineum]|uniref:Uncharacterized protein n=1 Tax=Pseudosporangium ferrugineum TaxID=439699 RepID=A0A2T0RE88_9ACTN|nr:hypothetical protein [Pseudosporangium ferrugineum]PRY19473.1 hypothetical protein CLV70_1322 [Pseudosporangium ferrugineum]